MKRLIFRLAIILWLSAVIAHAHPTPPEKDASAEAEIELREPALPSIGELVASVQEASEEDVGDGEEEDGEVEETSEEEDSDDEEDDDDEEEDDDEDDDDEDDDDAEKKIWLPPVPPPPPPPPKREGDVVHNLTGNSGRLATPNFPSKYKENSRIKWNIEVEEGMKIKLTIHLLNIENHMHCIWDWVKVFDSNGTLIKHVCGYLQQDLVLYTSANNASVSFYSDGVIQSVGFMASWMAVPLDYEPQEQKSNEGYVLAFPQTFTKSAENDPENVCLQLLNIEQDGLVEVSMFTGKSILNGTPDAVTTFEHEAGNKDIRCTKMNLPEDFEALSAVLEVKGSFPGSDYEILSYKSVRALGTEPMILVQTDKAEYRPKQAVKIRVLALNYQLKPAVQDVVHEIWLTNPSNDRLAQWKEVQLKKGIAQMEFTLSDEPQLGSWTVHVKYTDEEETEVKAEFVVAENVLPKFEVKIESAPAKIVRTSEEENFTICALYTHGGSVKGALNATFHANYKKASYYGAPILTTAVSKLVPELDKDGCATVTLNNSELNEFAGRTRSFKLLAKVAEAVTETELNATAKMEFVYSPFKITFGASPDKHIIGGFPYVGKIVARTHGGAPVAGETLEVCSRLFTSLDKMRNEINRITHHFYSYTEDQFVSLGLKVSKILHKSVCIEAQTREDGTLPFAVPLYDDIPLNVTKLSIKVKSVDSPANPDMGMLQPKSKLDIQLTHSNASSALTIRDEEEERSVACGETEVEIFLSGKFESTVELAHYVSSGGALVSTGTEMINIGAYGVDALYVGKAVTIDMGSQKNGTDTVLTVHRLTIKRPFMDEGKVTSKLRLLVLTRDDEGETLSTTREYEAESCAKKPDVKWSAEKLNPGDAARLEVFAEGASEAHCGYSVVDKSVDLVANSNKVTTARLQKLKEAIAKARIIDDQNDRAECSDGNLLFKAFERLGLFVMSDTLVVDTECDSLVDVTKLSDRENGRPEIPSAIPQVQAMELGGGFGGFSADYDMADEGAALFADAAPEEMQAQAAAPPPGALNNRFGGGNRQRPLASPQFAVQRKRPTAVKKNKVELRNYFPETWLFDLIDLDSDGRAALNVTAPHTITTWVAEVICSSENTGMTVSDKANVLVTQDFFADLYMPYYVKRGEILPINISVFNNVDRPLPMKLTVAESEAFKIDEASQAMCLVGDSNEIRNFYIKATQLHEVNVTVEARITDDNEEECAGKAGDAEGFTDKLKKSIQVKPEGFPVEKVQSIFECKDSEDEPESTVTLEKLNLPKDVVMDSERAWIMITGDIMAPALSNLGKLLKLPTGCGEQNMMGMAPNVYLMEYLSGTGKRDKDIEHRARQHMETGYKRENEKFRHKDGSYSVWGPETDKEGSMWLTVFVMKIFSQASKFISVDERMLKQSLDWVSRHQMRTGCFPAKGFAIHSEIKGSDASLTAAVIITLLELKQNNGMDVPEEVMTMAVECAASNMTEDDVYRKSLMTYAVSLHNQVYPERKEQLEKIMAPETALSELIESADSTTVPGQLYWTTGDAYNSAVDVEMTAYNVLSMVMGERLPEALKAIRWLATKRNSNGGFISTQDTMVALQAMSQYSTNVRGTLTEMELTLKEDEHKFVLTENNKLLLQKFKLTELPAEPEVSISGTGCYMVQSVLRYNVYESPEKEAFTMTAKQDRGSGELRICAAYTGSKAKTDMTVVEVELLSGYTADVESLAGLKNEIEAPVKKFEYDEKEGRIVLYFDQMPKEENCWTITLKPVAKVAELKDAIVKIYDYYNQKDVFSTKYNLE